LLMEFCNGGGLIDFMNTRLQNRLTEPEILKIFSDVAEGVACMHYLKPPLLHRDLKVENVLINSSGSTKRFKLCDFGSTAPPRPAATTASECRLIEDDVQKHTTLQYRSPEMIDVYRKQAIDEKSDIWALGVLLYKLCYYTTPFEAQGQLAILNASFKFPAYPLFSDKLKKLIASMLKENPISRPNIYQVLREACLMQGIEVPIRDVFFPPIFSRTLLTCVDLCWKNAIGIAAQPTTSILTRHEHSLSSSGWSCIFSTCPTKADNSRNKTHAARKTYCQYPAPCFKAQSIASRKRYQQ
jgi:serine/threonine protein kinase